MRIISAGKLVFNVLGKTFFFVSGAYAAQNYNLPDIRALISDNFPSARPMLDKMRGNVDVAPATATATAGVPEQFQPVEIVLKDE